MSFLSIDDADPRPPYEQLTSQLLTMISSGELGPGDRLAPIRQLAGDLAIAPNTVARAYRELEQIGVIVSRGRRGTVVTEQSISLATSHAADSAADTLRTAVDQAVAAGLDRVEILRLVERRFGDGRASA